MNCERYRDFVAICSFMNAFGENVLCRGSDRVPSIYQIKQMIERTESRLNQKDMSAFMMSLLEAYFGSKRSDIETNVDKGLVTFLMKKNLTKSADIVRNCGFNLLDTKNKLSILRALLEAQLETGSNNQRCKKYLSTAKASLLRPSPIGRDASGNWYWEFRDSPGSAFIVVKELVDDNSSMYFEYVRMDSQIASLINRINDEPVTRYCGGSECKRVKYERDLLTCTHCKNRWHAKCIVDSELHYDQTEWQCPDCDQVDLLEVLKGRLREE